MKKLLAVAAAAVVTAWARSKSKSDQAERDLWAEATDTV